VCFSFLVVLLGGLGGNSVGGLVSIFWGWVVLLVGWVWGVASGGGCGVSWVGGFVLGLCGCGCGGRVDALLCWPMCVYWGVGKGRWGGGTGVLLGYGVYG